MRYLICVPYGTLCKIRVVSDPDMIIHGPFEVWTLQSGRQILVVECKLHKLLQKYHVGGSYEAGAIYGLSYYEMVLILSDQLGPTDRERYATALRNQALARGMDVSLAGLVMSRVLGTIVKFLARGTFMLVVLVLLPILIRLLKKPK